MESIEIERNEKKYKLGNISLSISIQNDLFKLLFDIIFLMQMSSPDFQCKFYSFKAISVLFLKFRVLLWWHYKLPKRTDNKNI